MKIADWKKRPSFAAQCRTWEKATELGVATERFRSLPSFRDAKTQLARSKVARAIRIERRQRATEEATA